MGWIAGRSRSRSRSKKAPGEPNPKLYVANLEWTVDSDALRAHLSAAGSPPAVDVAVVMRV